MVNLIVKFEFLTLILLVVDRLQLEIISTSWFNPPFLAPKYNSWIRRS
jgi:hypothetical protein